MLHLTSCVIFSPLLLLPSTFVTFKGLSNFSNLNLLFSAKFLIHKHSCSSTVQECFYYDLFIGVDLFHPYPHLDFSQRSHCEPQDLFFLLLWSFFHFSSFHMTNLTYSFILQGSFCTCHIHFWAFFLASPLCLASPCIAHILCTTCHVCNSAAQNYLFLLFYFHCNNHMSPLTLHTIFLFFVWSIPVLPFSTAVPFFLPSSLSCATFSALSLPLLSWPPLAVLLPFLGALLFLDTSKDNNVVKRPTQLSYFPFFFFFLVTLQKHGKGCHTGVMS